MLFLKHVSLFNSCAKFQTLANKSRKLIPILEEVASYWKKLKTYLAYSDMLYL